MTYKLMGERRYDHVLSVATHARRLMKANTLTGRQANNAYLAGLVHDNHKYVEEKEIRKYLGKDFDSIPYKALHGYATAK